MTANVYMVAGTVQAFTYSSMAYCHCTCYPMHEDCGVQRENNAPTFNEGQSQDLVRGQTLSHTTTVPLYLNAALHLLSTFVLQALLLFLNSGGKRI